MRRPNSGFTLIELVVVLVILGILSVVAIPKFVDLTNLAKCRATQEVYGSIHSAVVLAYSERAANGNPSFPPSIDQTNFANNTLPLNKLNGKQGVGNVASQPATMATSTTNGFWYMPSTGRSGIYSDGTINPETCEASGGGCGG